MKNAKISTTTPGTQQYAFESFMMCADFHKLQTAHNALLVNCLFKTPSKKVVELTPDQRNNLLLLLNFLTDLYEYSWQEKFNKKE